LYGASSKEKAFGLFLRNCQLTNEMQKYGDSGFGGARKKSRGAIKRQANPVTSHLSIANDTWISETG
jgi:hypothetical protein